MLRNTLTEWGSIAKGFHWTMAILILAMFVLGWLAAGWPLSPTKIKLFFWHKSIGITLLVFAVLRLAWRMVNPSPALPADSPRWQRCLAGASHALLYALMLLMPLSGWVINSAANFPFKVFGLVPLPVIAPNSKTVQGWAEIFHLSAFWVLAVLVLIHAFAALRHHWSYRDEVLRRMLPFR